MKGNPKIIETLNKLLAGEFGAIQQYLAHEHIVRNWGYTKLADYIKERTNDERGHANMLMERIVFLEGNPVTDKLPGIFVSNEIPNQLSYDLMSERGAVKDYTDAIFEAEQLQDFTTRDILSKILADEQEHINEIEERQANIAQMGLPNFLLYSK